MIVGIEDIPQIVIVLFVGLLNQFSAIGYVSLTWSIACTLFKLTLCSSGTLLLNDDRNLPTRAELTQQGIVRNGNNSNAQKSTPGRVQHPYYTDHV